MTRILTLNAATEKELLRARQFRDTEAERVADRIIADVRRRGDTALFAWTKKLDHLSLDAKNVYLPCRGAAWLRPCLPGREESTSLRVSPAFLRAIKHATRRQRTEGGGSRSAFTSKEACWVFSSSAPHFLLPSPPLVC